MDDEKYAYEGRYWLGLVYFAALAGIATTIIKGDYASSVLFVIGLFALTRLRTLGYKWQQYMSESDSIPEEPLVLDREKHEPQAYLMRTARNPRVYGPLVNYIMNSGDIPPEGLPLTWSIFKNKHGMAHADWKSMCEFIQAKKYRGYIAPTRGGNYQTWIRRAYAESCVEKARKHGLIGGIPHTEEGQQGEDNGTEWVSTI